MKAIIPAAGYATRLYPLTKRFPKALIRIGSKPVIEHIIHKIQEIPKVKEVIIITNNRFYKHFLDWKKGFSSNVGIEILNDGTKTEKDRLGAIGDKHFALKELGIKDDVLDICSDNVFDFSLIPMYNYFKQKNAIVIGLYDVKHENKAKKFGVVALNGEKVVSFHEKPEKPPSTLASIGVYMYPKNKVKHFHKYIEAGHNPDNPGFFLEWLHKVEEVYGFPFKSKWFDIGSHESLKEARNFFEEKK